VKFNLNISITIICLIMGVSVAWQYKSVYNNKKTASIQTVTLEDLKDKLILEKKSNEELRTRYEELEKELNGFEAAKGNIDLYKKNLNAEIEKARIIAGFSTVKGSGIVITIKDTDFGMALQSQHLLQIVNTLKATEARAIAVNDERIIPMTEISDVGNVIIVNGMPIDINEPVKIKVIMESQKRDNAIKTLGYIISELREKNIEVSPEKVEGITIPGVKNSRPSLNNDLLITE